MTVNQHNVTCKNNKDNKCECGSERALPGHEWWSGEFKASIRAIGRVAAVLSPWNAPAPLTRSWCLWELFCADQVNAPLTVALSQAQHSAFVDALQNDFASIATSLARVDVRNATAWSEHDQAMIHGAVETSVGGISGLNAAIHAQLRGWLADAGRKALDALPAGKRGTSALINNLASLLNAQGHLDQAEPLYREALAARRETLGDRHPDTLSSSNGLADLLRKQGTAVKADALSKEGLGV